MRVLAAVTALVVLVAAVWWIATPSTDPAASATTVRASTAAVDALIEPGKLVDSVEDARATSVPAARSEAAAAQLDGDLLIECVRDVDGTPSSGARVWFVPPTAAETPATAEEIEAWITAQAPRIADAAGRLSTAQLPRATVVVGRTVDLFGALGAWHAETDSLRLRLYADSAPLVVRVVDAAGRPIAGLPVSLRVRDRSDGSLDVRLTDASGLATFLHSRPRLLQYRLDHAQPLVALDIVSAARFEAELDLDALPTSPIELVAPPFGSLEVALAYWDGKPLDPSSSRIPTALVACVDPNSTTGLVVARGASHLPFVFPAVEVGASVHLDLDPYWSDAWASQIVAGPQSPGDRATATFRMVPREEPFRGRMPLVVGRVVDPNQRPIAGAQLSLVVGDALATAGASSRSDGRFCTRLTLSWLHPDEPVALVGPIQISGTMAQSAGNDDAPGRFELAAAMAPPSSAGIIDLGDVVVTEVAAGDIELVAGRIVDRRGSPVASALVSATLVDGKHETRSRSLDVRTFDDGTFRVLGPRSDGEVEIRATTWNEASSESIRCTIGRTDVVVVIPSGAIAGRLLVDEGIDPRELMISNGPRILGHPERDGSFRFRDLPIGEFDLTVNLPRATGEVLGVEGVVVVAGESTRDPRLEVIDLRGKLSPWNVRVLDRDGKRIEVGECLLCDRIDSDSDANMLELDFGGAGVNLILPHSSFDLVLASDGYERVRVRRDRSQQEVRLASMPMIELVIPGGLPKEPKGLDVWVGLSPADYSDDEAHFALSAAWFDERDTVALAAPCFGRVRVSCELRMPPGYSGDQPSEPAPEFIDVLDSAGPQRFTLKLDRAAIEAALRGSGR